MEIGQKVWFIDMFGVIRKGRIVGLIVNTLIPPGLILHKISFSVRVNGRKKKLEHITEHVYSARTVKVLKKIMKGAYDYE